MTMASGRVVVVGGGVIGLHTALQVKRLVPEAAVSLLEQKNNLGYGSSGWSSAILRCKYTHEFMTTLARDGLEAHRHWNDYLRLPSRQTEAKLFKHPILWMLPGMDSEAYASDAARFTKLGLGCEILDSAHCQDMYPLISMEDYDSAGTEAYFLETEAGYINPSSVLADLGLACRDAGVEMLFRKQVTSFEAADDERVSHVVCMDGGEVHGDVFVSALGPWYTNMTLAHNHVWDIAPTRIQVVHKPWTCPDMSMSNLPITCDALGGIYFRPDFQTDHVVVSTILPEEESERVTNPDDFNQAADPEQRTRYLSSLHERIPTLTPRGSIKSYSALYTLNFSDGHPIVGPVGQSANWLNATGFTGHGFKIAPAIGSMLAQMATRVEARATPFQTVVDPSALSASRVRLADSASVLA